jgi:hypothetical protein
MSIPISSLAIGVPGVESEGAEEDEEEGETEICD